MMDTPVSELSGYAFTLLREGDFPLYRGSGDSLVPVLLVTAEDASLACLNRLEHEYALRAELDIAWAARPVAMSRYHGQLTLVLEDPGGEPLDRQGLQAMVARYGRLRSFMAPGEARMGDNGIAHTTSRGEFIFLDC